MTDTLVHLPVEVYGEGPFRPEVVFPTRFLRDRRYLNCRLDQLSDTVARTQCPKLDVTLLLNSGFPLPVRFGVVRLLTYTTSTEVSPHHRVP